jgi:hypothetical protein
VKLKHLHDKTGLTAYAVWKETGISQTTVRKYTETDEVEVDYLPAAVFELIKFYGADWRDPSVIEEAYDGKDESSPEKETALPVAS